MKNLFIITLIMITYMAYSENMASDFSTGFSLPALLPVLEKIQKDENSDQEIVSQAQRHIEGWEHFKLREKCQAIMQEKLRKNNSKPLLYHEYGFYQAFLITETDILWLKWIKNDEIKVLEFNPPDELIALVKECISDSGRFVNEVSFISITGMIKYGDVPAFVTIWDENRKSETIVIYNLSGIFSIPGLERLEQVKVLRDRYQKLYQIYQQVYEMVYPRLKNKKNVGITIYK